MNLSILEIALSSALTRESNLTGESTLARTTTLCLTKVGEGYHVIEQLEPRRAGQVR